MVLTFLCKAFEDNSRPLEILKSPKMRLRTKNLNLVYHHSREHVRIRIIQIFTIFPDFQLAVTFTKLLPQIKFKNSGKVLLASNPNHMCREGVLIYTLLYYNYLLNSFGYIIQNITLYALCIFNVLFIWSRHKIVVPSMTRS